MSMQKFAQLQEERTGIPKGGHKVSILSNIVKAPEQQIQQAEASPGFAIALLQIVSNDQFPQTSRLAAALYFKNLVKRRWADADGNHLLPQEEVTQIKRDIVGLMISCPPNIQSQLGEAVSIIADVDFHTRWDTLIDDLVSRLSPENPIITDGVLKVSHSIFKRWRPLLRSDELFTEILHVLERFTNPFLNLILTTDNLVSQNQSNKVLLQQHMAVLNTSVKVLHDLTCQDMPDAIVGQLDVIVALMDKYLKYDNNLLSQEDEAGLEEYVKAAIFGLLTLWTTKYEEDLRKHIGGLTGTSWNLLTSLAQDTKYDILASRGMNFLTSVAGSPNNASTFSNEDALKQIIEKVVLPNITLREADEELFEDEPIEYIRRDLEGADSDTRRRAATDLLRRLMQSFPDVVTRLTMHYVESALQSYASDHKSRWKSKDTAIYLFCAIAAVGTVTQASGVQNTNERVNVISFFSEHIAVDLTTEPSHAILQVDAIKFLYTFRKQLTQQQWQQALPLVVQRLASSNYVVHTYSAIAIERTLFLTDDNKQPKIPRATVSPLAKDILTQLFKLISASSAPEKVQENEFLIRCVMRVLVVIREDVVSLADFLTTSFTNIMRVIRHNPSNPRFYYYLFESIGALIRFAGPSQPDKLENAFFDPFMLVLTDNVYEFIPYAFQLFAALLEANPTAPISDNFTKLIQPVLSAQLWETRGNTPALARLLVALISRGSTHILQNNQLQPILGLFQLLISSKSYESLGFDVLDALILHIPNENMQEYYQTIFSLIFSRLSNSRTENLARCFVRLYHSMSIRNSPQQGLGADAIESYANAAQEGSFTPMYLQVVLPDSQKLTRPVDRKTAIVSFTKTLADSRVFAEKYAKGWGFTAEALLKLMTEAPVVTRDGEEAIVEQDTEDVGFGVGFTALSTCRRPPLDPCPDVQDVRGWTREYLTAAAVNNPKIQGYIQERLNDQTRNGLAQLMQ
ncbi:MAG: hypothetical protein Q9162_005616 [Coniocarpon cinnabarinum]